MPMVSCEAGGGKQMREIIFRGKRIDNGEWVYGYYVRLYGGKKNKVSRRIYSVYAETDCDNYYPNWFEVIPATVGQYTGLTDKHGKKIFEDDVVRVHDTLLRCDEPYHEFIGIVGFKDASFAITCDCFTHYRWQDYEIEVIGNTHDAKLAERGEAER